jgi:hypothetical protein
MSALRRMNVLSTIVESMVERIQYAEQFEKVPTGLGRYSNIDRRAEYEITFDNKYFSVQVAFRIKRLFGKDKIDGKESYKLYTYAVAVEPKNTLTNEEAAYVVAALTVERTD